MNLLQKNRKSQIFILVLAAIAFVGLGALGFWLYQEKLTKKPFSFFFPSVGPETTEIGRIPLGVSPIDRSKIDFLNQVLRDSDYLIVRSRNMDLLKDFKGKKTLIITGQEFNQIESLVSQAKTLGVDSIGFNLEGPYSKQELVEKEKKVYEIVKRHGLTYIFGPTVVNLEKHYQDFALYADVIALQAQRYQTQSDFKKRVADLISKIKEVNPNVKVSVQVAVNPPDVQTKKHVTLSTEELIYDIQEISDVADKISIFHGPAQSWPTVEEALKQLRS